MDRASPVGQASGSRRRGAGVLPPLAAAVAGILFYVVPFGVRHLRMPVGDDAIDWVLSLRVVGRLGLSNPQLAARPAFPLAASVLGTATGASAWTVAVVAPIAMAAATGLAAAAIAARWRVQGWGLAAFATLAGASGVVARLVAGKDENVMALWLMAAVLAVAVWGVWDRPQARRPAPAAPARRMARRGLLAPAVLVAVVTLVEWPLAAVFVGILLVSWAVALLARLGSSPALRGIAETEAALRALAVAATAGAVAGAALLFVVDRVGPGSGIQNLPPGYRYQLRLRDELSLIVPWLTGTLTLLGLLAARGREERPPAIGVVSGVWLAGTVAVVTAGWIGVSGPTYRALTLALPVALATAAAAFLPAVWPPGAAAKTRGRQRGAGRRTGVAVLTSILAVASLVPALSMWWRAELGTPTSTEQLSEVAAAARYAAGLPGRAPVVLVASRVDLPFAESLLYGRMASAVAAPGTFSRVLIFVGRAQDALAGRPTLGLGSAQDQVSRRLFRRLGPALAAGAPVLSGRALDPAGYRSARRSGAPTIAGGILALARGPAPDPALLQPISVVPLPGPFAMFAVGLGMLALMTLAGIGWSAAAVRGAPPEIRWLVAPPFGAAALSLVAFVLVHAGIDPSGWGAWLTIGIVLAGSALAWRGAGRAPRPRGAATAAPSVLRSSSV